MIPHPLIKIGLNELNALLGQVQESKTIEFKRAMPGGKEKDLEFLKGVSAFANTAGGDFIVGIAATKDGVAEIIPGIAIAKVDEEKLRLESILRTGLDPSLPRVDIHEVACGNGNYVLVVRIPHS